MQTYLNGTTSSDYYYSLSTIAKSMIEPNGTWLVGECAYDIAAADAYTCASATSYTDKVGLVASYEYLYAADSSCYSTSGNNYVVAYGGVRCCQQDWMYELLTNNGTGYAWLLSPRSDLAFATLSLNSDGAVPSSSYVNNTYGTFPAVYLNSTVTITGGTGESTNPYRLG